MNERMNEERNELEIAQFLCDSIASCSLLPRSWLTWPPAIFIVHA